MAPTPNSTDPNSAGASAGSTSPTDAELFSSRGPQPSPFSVMPWAIAGLVVAALIVILLLAGHHKPAPAPNAILPPDPDAASLAISDIIMSESTSLSGGKSTFIDGHIRNTGTHTVTGIRVQVLFANDEALPPQVETLPLALIRTHEPYVDTQPVSAAPLAPGDDREFRLIFEDIGANWNQQLPQIHIVGVTRK